VTSFDEQAAREVFEFSTDFTIGLEEEFALLDPDTLSLSNVFEELRSGADQDEVLAESVAGELIASEVEIRSGKGENFHDALERQHERRRRLFALADSRGVALGATGTHPWSPWQEQRIIDTPHYRLVEEKLKYVAWRNNTFSNHVHVGIRDADRAVAVCDALRQVLPVLLAASANSPFVEARLSGLHSARTEVFTRMFPRCGVPDHFGSWKAYAEYVDFLFRTRSIDEHTEIWWSVRPHLSFGTVEIRIMDAQSCAGESTALLALATACAAQAALDHDAGRRAPAPPNRLIEENLWRAIRYGLSGELIDLATGEVRPAREALAELVEWVAPVAEELGCAELLQIPAENAAERQMARHDAGESMESIYAQEVLEAVRV
jgi:glutamate---cysteine ligase / carboxylate-amine ligase